VFQSAFKICLKLVLLAVNAEKLWLYIVCVKSPYYCYVESHILKAVLKNVPLFFHFT